MASFSCDLCSRGINKADSIDYSLNGTRIKVCTECSYRLEALKNNETKKEALQYLQDNLHRGNASSVGETYISDTLGMYSEGIQFAENEKVEKRPVAVHSPAYNDPSSAGVVKGLAVVLMIIGVIGILVGIFSNPTIISAGVVCIISCVFLFVVANISCDIHHMDYIATENMRLQKEILKLLKGKNS